MYKLIGKEKDSFNTVSFLIYFFKEKVFRVYFVISFAYYIISDMNMSDIQTSIVICLKTFEFGSNIFS